MHQKLLKKTTIYCFVFFVIAMVGMFYFDAKKVIVIANSDEGVTKPDSEMTENLQTQYQLLMQNDTSNAKQITIPLENAILAEDVQIQNHYIDNELWIGINGATAEFYSQEYIVGDLENVQYGGYDMVGDILWIKLAMKDTFEFESTMNNGKLTIKVQKPTEVYDKIIILDAGHGGKDKGDSEGRVSEKKLTLDVLLILQEKFKESDIKVYYTRTDDTQVDNEKRIQLANSVGADMLISLHTAYSEDSSLHGVTTIYNGNYFIQDFGSIQLSDILEQSVAQTTGANANGLQDATEDDFLVKEAKVPAAQINIGYLSNEEERKLLQDEEYQQLIADGIYYAIMEIYEENLEK